MYARVKGTGGNISVEDNSLTKFNLLIFVREDAIRLSPYSRVQVRYIILFTVL